MTMTAPSSKRKADCLAADGAEDALEALSNMLHEHIEVTNRNLDALNKRMTTLEEMTERKQESQDTQGFDDDISDDEEQIAPSDKFTPMFNLLRAYRYKNGHCKVRGKDDKKLHKWIENQRFKYGNTFFNKKGAKLSQEKIIKLESIGFEFGSKFDPPSSWDEMYQKLVAFKKGMGHCNVPFNEKHPNELAKWSAFQRKEYMHFKYGRLSLITLEQIAMLNDIGFKWKGPKLPN